MACWLSEDGGEVRFYLRKTFEPGVLGYRQTEWLGLMAMLTAIQFFAGPNWQPIRISVRSKGPAPGLAYELFGNAEFLMGQAEIFIAFPRAMLGLAHALHGTDPRFQRPKPAAIGLGDDEPAADFANRLRQCLKPISSTATRTFDWRPASSTRARAHCSGDSGSSVPAIGRSSTVRGSISPPECSREPTLPPPRSGT